MVEPNGPNLAAERVGRGRTQAAFLAGGLVIALAIGLGLTQARAADPEPAAKDAAAQAVALAPAVSQVFVPPRSPGLEFLPCTRCHDESPKLDGEAKSLGPHRFIEFDHMPAVKRCFLCHNENNLNELRLITGEPVSIDAAHELCGQCHSDKARDFELGIHGKQVGSWRGLKHRYACTDCHDAHHPKRQSVEARPPPPFPKLGIRKGEH